MLPILIQNKDRQNDRQKTTNSSTPAGSPGFTERIRHAITASSPSSAGGHLGLPAVPTYVPSVSRKYHFKSCFLFPPSRTEMFGNRLSKWIRPVASGRGSGAARPARPPSRAQGASSLAAQVAGGTPESAPAPPPAEPLLCGQCWVRGHGPGRSEPPGLPVSCLKVGNKSTYFIKIVQVFFSGFTNLGAALTGLESFAGCSQYQGQMHFLFVACWELLVLLFIFLRSF